MLNTKPKSKKLAIPWKRAKTVVVPVLKTGTKFRAYPDDPPRPCEVTASFQFLPVAGRRWAYRIKVDTPLFADDDPICDTRIPLGSERQAISAAVLRILDVLRHQVELRRTHKQLEIASACAQAVWHVQQFQKHFIATGKLLTRAAVPAGAKQLEQFSEEVAAVDKSDPPLISFDPKRMRKLKCSAAPGMAIAVRGPEVITVVAAPIDEHAPLRQLTAREEKELTGYEGQITQSYLIACRALNAIITKGLWEGRAASPLAYARKRFGWGRSRAYQAIHVATEIEPFVSPIAEKLDLEISDEFQFRKLLKLGGKSEIEPVLRKTAHKLKFAHSPGRAPTGKLLEEAVDEFTKSADELREARDRAAEAARLRAAHQRQGLDREPAAETPLGVPRVFAAGPESIATEDLASPEILRDLRDATMTVAFDRRQRRNTLVDICPWEAWLEILRGPQPLDGSDPGYWNGEPNRHARQLRGLAQIVQRLAAWQQPGPPGVEGSGSSPRKDLPELLHSLAADISGERRFCRGLPVKPLSTSRRRAK